MNFSHNTEELICTIELFDQLTKQDLAGLDSLIDELTAEPHVKGVLVNLENFEYFDSAGLGKIVAISTILENNNARMALSNMNRRVLEAFRMTRLDSHLNLFSKMDEAMVYLQSNH